MAGVQQSPWKSLSSGKKVAMAAGLSVCATVGYIVYRHIRSSSAPAQWQKTEQARISMPLNVYRSIARHQSTFLDLVAQKSGAQVNVLSDAEDPSFVSFLLQGKAEQVLLAKYALEKLATDSELITDVIEVPQSAFGRIIGRGGEMLKLISRTSGARVNCPRESGHSLEDKGKVTIMGTRQEVQRAKDMIMEKVFENETVRKRISQSSALRHKRRAFELEPVSKSQNSDTEHMQNVSRDNLLSPLTDMELTQATSSNGFASTTDYTTENSLKSEEGEILSPLSPLEYSKFEIPSPDLGFQPGEHLEVYVSASENPQHFWIQIIGVRSLQLDKLTAEMSRFYNGDAMQEHRVDAIVVGDIVAAPYQDHGTWNRARVLGVLGSGLVDLYYVDFGDNGELPRDQLRSMRSDFLSLPFQAIECSLAGVRPSGEFWTEEALDDFERMTHCAEWKPLLAKLCSYSHTELSSWPSVKLYEKSHEKSVDLGEELIRLGHAISCQDEMSGLADDPDEPRSLLKLLDDMTGATSELSLSCISLSGPTMERKQLAFSSSSFPSSVEAERADVDQNSTGRPITAFSSMICSTPSLNLSELVSNIESSGSVLCPESNQDLDPRTSAQERPAKFLDLPSRDQGKHMQASYSPITSSAINSVSLSDVFVETYCSSTSVTLSSESVELEESHSTCNERYGSNDAIRGVWYYLTSSQDSSRTSLNTTMPMSSTRSSSSYPKSSSSCLTEFEDSTSVTSSSVILLSSDPSECPELAAMCDGAAAEHFGGGHMNEKCSIIELNDSSSGSDVIYMNSKQSGCLDKGSDVHPSESNVMKQQLLPGVNIKPDHADSLKEGNNGKQVALEAENKTDNIGDKEVASISGSVDDVLDDEFN